MNEEEVVALMLSSKSAQEWNANCDKVKRACKGYPEFWWHAVKEAGLDKKAQAAHGWSA